nr:hypothetical protein [uncultured Rhodoferax sp.]
MQIKFLALASIVAFSAGCASTPPLGNVIPQAGGSYQVISTGSTKNDALASALHTAESTCSARKMHHIVSGEQTKYKGVVSEETNTTLNKAQEIIAATTGAWLPTLSGDEDYQMTMSFSCEL